MTTQRRRRRLQWTPSDEAFIVLRERSLQEALSGGISLGSGYKLAVRDREGAESLANQIYGRDWVILRIDMTGLADRVAPNAPMARGEWVSPPFGIGDTTYLIGEIPASAISDVTAEPSEPTLPSPR